LPEGKIPLHRRTPTQDKRDGERRTSVGLRGPCPGSLWWRIVCSATWPSDRGLVDGGQLPFESSEASHQALSRWRTKRGNRPGARRPLRSPSRALSVLALQPRRAAHTTAG
jgi:hypothetical protein